MSLTRRYGGLSILLSQSVISRLLFFCAVVAPIFHAYDSVSVIVVTAAQAEGECDANSSDQSCAAPIDQEEGTGDDRECVDTNPSCRSWASVGECDNNPNYMLSEFSLIDFVILISLTTAKSQCLFYDVPFNH